MAKKVVASLRDTSGVKYAKLIQSVKSEKTGSYSFKEEIIIEDHVKDILAGKSHEDIIRELRAKEKEAEAAKLAAEITITGPITLGRMCLKIIREDL